MAVRFAEVVYSLWPRRASRRDSLVSNRQITGFRLSPALPHQLDRSYNCLLGKSHRCHILLGRVRDVQRG